MNKNRDNPQHVCQHTGEGEPCCDTCKAMFRAMPYQVTQVNVAGTDGKPRHPAYRTLLASVSKITMKNPESRLAQVFMAGLDIAAMKGRESDAKRAERQAA